MPIQTVLLVDDEPDIRKIGEISLRVIGRWTVLLAASGAEGLRVAIAARPDVILLDVMMPGTDGTTTLAQLRAEPATAAIPVILITARVQAHEVAHYRALGAAGVVHKPFDPMKLPAEVRRIVAESAPP